MNPLRFDFFSSTVFDQDLESDVKSDTSGSLRKVLVTVLEVRPGTCYYAPAGERDFIFSIIIRISCYLE